MAVVPAAAAVAVVEPAVAVDASATSAAERTAGKALDFEVFDKGRPREWLAFVVFVQSLGLDFASLIH